MHKVIQAGFIIVALSGGFYAADIIQTTPDKTSELVADDYCQLSTLQCQQQSITMTQARDEIQPLVATPLIVDWPDTDADTLLLKLRGMEMDMGEVRFVLQRNTQGVFTTDVTLPVCTAGSMTWIGSLTDGKQTVYPSIRMQR